MLYIFQENIFVHILYFFLHFVPFEVTQAY